MLSSQIVDAYQHDGMRDPTTRKNVAVEARHEIGSNAIAQHTPAADTGIDHAHRWRALARHTSRQRVGPAVVAIGGGAAAIGDRITNRDHHTDTARYFDFNVG